MLAPARSAQMPPQIPTAETRVGMTAPTMGPVGQFAMRLWTADPLLTGTGLFLMALLAPLSLGLLLDLREIGGAPAWLKPTKFAVSTALYCLTLAWVFTHLAAWPRTRRVVSRVTSALFLLEVAAISLQAARGTTSHFNAATPLDATIFGVMGIAILVQTLASVAVGVALWRQPFVDRALGWALRLGMTIAIVGALTGGLMTAPTEAQLSEARTTGRITVAGAHTVGGPDGGPGLPVTGWSTRHGDLRVAHFVGLHALQVLPIVALVVFRGRAERARIHLTMVAAIAYTLLFVGLLVQALQGLPLIQMRM